MNLNEIYEQAEQEELLHELPLFAYMRDNAA